MSSIPDAILAAIIAAGSAIAGAMIAWIGVYLQLRHQSKEGEKERQMALRRDVYLFVTKQIGEMLDYLANFYSMTGPAPRDYTPAIEQVHIVGTDEMM